MIKACGGRGPTTACTIPEALQAPENANIYMVTEEANICYRCVGNPQLVHVVRGKGQFGKCAVCGRRRRHVVPFSALGPMLRNVAEIYAEVQDNYSAVGDLIADLLQADWDILAEDIVDKPEVVNETILALLDAGLHHDHDEDVPDYRYGRFVTQSHRLAEVWTDRLEEFLTLKRDMTLQGAEPGLPDILEAAFEDCGREYPAGTIFYRARSVTDRRQAEPFPLSDLGAPPPEKAKAGRVCKVGEPVLYVTTDEETAVAEARPWRGAAVAIARMEATRRIRVVDLVSLPQIENPFTDELVVWKVQLQALFGYLSYELSVPVIPGYPDAEYVVSQKLCRLMEQAGYDGVTYESSLGTGNNSAFFDVRAAEPVRVHYVRVQDIGYKTESIADTAPFYDERPLEALRS